MIGIGGSTTRDGQLEQNRTYLGLETAKMKARERGVRALFRKRWPCLARLAAQSGQDAKLAQEQHIEVNRLIVPHQVSLSAGAR